ncbi:hypothetical protein EDD85DRAFT_796546 [Armillaria nabsnona]|nr:hypothetical protein EDD85DRAFT_796546 [Armillaria nabsnona]
MAELTDPQGLAKVQAQDLYNAAAAMIDSLLDDFPNPTWDSTKMDTWLIDAITHWLTCEENWSVAGIGSKEWYKLEYSLIAQVPDLSMDKLDYNLDVVPLLVRHGQVKGSKATVSPSHSCQDAAATHSQVTTPAPLLPALKPTTPVPSPTKFQITEANTPKHMPPVLLTKTTPSSQLQTTPQPSTSTSGVSTKQVAHLPVNNATWVQQQTTQKAVKPTPGSNNVAFPPDPTSPLHQRPGNIFKVGPPIHAVRSMPAVQPLLSRLLSVDVATRSSVMPGPNPAEEGSVVPLPSICEPLFFPGTDDEEGPVPEGLVEEEQVDEEVAGTGGEDNDSDGPSNEDGESPPPTNKACQLCQDPRISFVFDETTGDFIESHLTIFLPRPTVPPAPTQGSKSDSKERKKDSKRKEKAAKSVVPQKQARDADNGVPIIEKLATKKLKCKGTAIADDKVVHATPAVRKNEPGPSKLPPVTLGTSGGGFGEKIPSSTKEIKNGIKSIGVLKVEKDFGNFVQVDSQYWNKDVAPFIGEHVSLIFLMLCSFANLYWVVY